MNRKHWTILVALLIALSVAGCISRKNWSDKSPDKETVLLETYQEEDRAVPSSPFLPNFKW